MIKQRTAIAILAGLMTTVTAYAADLKIKISNVKSSKGTIRIGLFNGAKGFPLKRKPMAVKEIQSASGTVNTTFSNLKPGTYAVSLFHDANGNKKLDTNLLGVPKEGYGVSNNARSALSPPKFAAAAFKFRAKDAQIKIKMGY